MYKREGLPLVPFSLNAQSAQKALITYKVLLAVNGHRFTRQYEDCAKTKERLRLTCETKRPRRKPPAK